MAEQSEQAIVPDRVVRHRDDPESVLEGRRLCEAAHGGNWIGDMLENVGRTSASKGWLAAGCSAHSSTVPWNTSWHASLASSTARAFGSTPKTRPPGLFSRRARVCSAAAPHIENVGVAPLREHVLREKRHDRRVRPLDVRVRALREIEREALALALAGARAVGRARARGGAHEPKTSRATSATARRTASSEVWRTRKPRPASLSGFTSDRGTSPGQPFDVVPYSMRALLFGDAATQSSAMRATLVESGGARL